jgi:hypothetical protein
VNSHILKAPVVVASPPAQAGHDGFSGGKQKVSEQEF